MNGSTSFGQKPLGRQTFDRQNIKLTFQNINCSVIHRYKCQKPNTELAKCLSANWHDHHDHKMCQQTIVSIKCQLGKWFSNNCVNKILCLSNACWPNDMVISVSTKYCVNQMPVSQMYIKCLSAKWHGHKITCVYKMFVSQMTKLRLGQQNIGAIKCLLAKWRGHSWVDKILGRSNVCWPNDKVTIKSTKYWVDQMSVGQMTKSSLGRQNVGSIKCLLAKLRSHSWIDKILGRSNVCWPNDKVTIRSTKYWVDQMFVGQMTRP